MASKNERIYRSLLSAIVGSDLTIREIRWLVEELSANGEFLHKLQEGLWRLADDLEIKFSRNYSSVNIDSSQDAGIISELIYDQVVSKKISKGELRSILGQLDRGRNWAEDSPKRTSRDLIERFVDESKPSAVVKLMDFLDMRQGEDSYLAGIDKKTKSP